MATGTTAASAVADLLRLAWLVGGEGKPGTRDALLTLAVAESGPESAVLAERCRRLLVARQPSHWFATTATLGQALTHPKVAGALTKLRAMFPPVRVQRLLLKFDVQKGPYTGSATSLERVLQGLSLAPEEGSAAGLASVSTSEHQSEPAGPRGPRRAVPFPGTPTAADPDGELSGLYLTVLLAMAVLLSEVASVPSPAAASDTRAA